ncbi:hypothetical protein, partial [Halopseudomonas sp.]|uniref:hypothetical protein n=1 Tax=Halopseudomonas sp. TaxID=2901191 RepID=UPI003563405F
MNTPCRAIPWQILRAHSAWLLLLCSLCFSVGLYAQTNETEASDETVDSVQSSDTSEFEALVHELVQGNLPNRIKTVNKLAAFDDERLPAIFTALAAGDLQADRNDPPAVAIRDGDVATDALTGETLASTEG